MVIPGLKSGRARNTQRPGGSVTGGVQGVMMGDGIGMKMERRFRYDTGSLTQLRSSFTWTLGGVGVVQLRISDFTCPVEGDRETVERTFEKSFRVRCHC